MESVTQKVRGFLGSTNIISPFKDYDLKEQTTHTKFYKVHDCIKKSSNEECSLFVFDKKHYEKQTGMTKQTLESIQTFVKKEAQILQRLRHPSMLNVVGVMEETKTHIYYSTEPVLSSLEDLIIGFKSRKSSKRDSGSLTEEGYKVKDFTFEELEVKSGIFQVLEGLHFLNSTAKLLHRAVSPQSIFITKSLKWKLAGLGFSTPFESQEPIIGLSLVDFHEYQYQDSTSILPNLIYLPPEFLYDKRFDYNSDLYSIGRLIYELSLLNGELNSSGGNINDNDDTHQISKLGVISYYKMKLEEIKQNANQLSPRYDSAKVSTILLGDTNLRGNLENFFKSAYFQDILTKSMVYLVNITQKEEESKLQFYRGLFNILSQFSGRIQCNYILPVLLSDLINERVIYVSLPCILSISNNHIKKEIFQTKVMGSLRPVFTSKEPKPEVLSCILSNIPLFVLKASMEQIKSMILPIVLGTLCGPTQDIIFQCLSVANVLFKFFESDVIGVGIIPRLCNLIGNTFPLHIRCQAINWLTQLVPQMDRKIVIDVLIPNLEKIIQNDNSPQILEALVQTYSAVSKKLGGELLALKVLPALMHISADKHLDIQQFQSIMKVVKEILTTYESEKLNELNNLQRYVKKDQPVLSPNEKIMEQFNNSIDTSSSSPSITNNNNNTSDIIKPISLPLPPQPIRQPSVNSSSLNTSNPFNNFISVSSPQSSTIISPSSSNNKSFLDSPDFTSYNSNSTKPTLNEFNISPIKNNNNNNINNTINIPLNFTTKPTITTLPTTTVTPTIQPTIKNNNINSSNTNTNINSFSNFDVLQPSSSTSTSSSSINNINSSGGGASITKQNPTIQPINNNMNNLFFDSSLTPLQPYSINNNSNSGASNSSSSNNFSNFTPNYNISLSPTISTTTTTNQPILPSSSSSSSSMFGSNYNSNMLMNNNNILQPSNNYNNNNNSNSFNNNNYSNYGYNMNNMNNTNSILQPSNNNINQTQTMFNQMNMNPSTNNYRN